MPRWLRVVRGMIGPGLTFAAGVGPSLQIGARAGAGLLYFVFLALARK